MSLGWEVCEREEKSSRTCMVIKISPRPLARS